MQDLNQLILRFNTYRDNRKTQFERTTGPLKGKRQLELDQATAICEGWPPKNFKIR